MTYISFSFVIFFFILAIIYFILPEKIRWTALLVFSYAFYYLACNKLPIYMLVTTVLTFVFTTLMQKVFDNSKAYLKEHSGELSKDEKKALKKKAKSKSKAIMIIAVVLNLLILCVFKYTDFLVGNAGSLLTKLGFGIQPRTFNLILPLGISFYTFQSLGYIIDVFRQKYRSETNFFKVALFVSYFPQIIEGPIGRFDHLAPQLFKGNKFSFSRTKENLFLILVGFAKKVVIADNLAPMITAVVGDYSNYQGFQIILTCMLYGIQLYADFSGCMDIAMGFSNILGIQLSYNFKRPYFSTSVAEFWRRWHISLCSWFRDYLFYPISFSSACKKISKKLKDKNRITLSMNMPKYIAMIVVWSLTGLWHAACWTEVLWGLINGVVMISSEQFKDTYDKINHKLHIKESSFVWKLFRILRTYVFMTFLNFMCEFDKLSDFIKCTVIALKNPLPTSFSPSYLFPEIVINGISCVIVVFIACILLLIHSIYDENHNESLIKKITAKSWIMQVIVLFLLFYTCALFGGAASDMTGGFMYAQF
ncbi:MAG: hypothetical protein MJ168_02060 [Clostridia bacterium]|nr:hypothetical protein [Clostridia bacterium]